MRGLSLIGKTEKGTIHMERSIDLRCCIPAMLSITVSLCLIFGLVPTAAFAVDASDDVQERPVQISKEVIVEEATSDEAEAVSSSDAVDRPAQADSVKQPSAQDAPQQPSSPQTSADVVLGADPETSKTILVDGLEYEVNIQAKTASLVGWYGSNPTKDISLPSSVADGTATYSVVAIGKTPDATTSSTSSNSNNSDKPSATSNKALGGVHILMPQNFSL